MDRKGILNAAIWAAAIIGLFSIYTIGINHNPPGYYVDESALSYNAYLVSRTGAGEFGKAFPLYFQIYTGGFTQWSNPTQIYLLALLFKIFGPGILIARLFAAACVFAACLLLGRLSARVSDSGRIGYIVGAMALVTPWLFEVGRLVLETFFYPLAVVLFLWALYYAQKKEVWGWQNILALVSTLTLLTYSYTIGRLFGGLMALGLALFVTSYKRLAGVLITWAAYGITLIPLIEFGSANPDLTTRFYLISYIKQNSTMADIIPQFLARFLDDLNPWSLLWVGDTNARHHLPGAFGSIFLGTFVLAVIGLVLIAIRHRRDRWWLFIVFGFLASIVPGALTNDHAHTLRMIAYPIFLLLLTVPALQWIFERPTDNEHEKQDVFYFASDTRRATAAVLAGLILVQGAYFHYKNYVEGPLRGYVFDTGYKTVYDIAVQQPERPIYLIDNYWGPAYIHALWYATLEGRDTSEFNHLRYGVKAPPHSLVISTEKECTNCELIDKEEIYLLYRTR
ncbi:MAG: glycosyltransferase family 39 protein [Acidobacteria bacterium]|nr:glycosyltransferase family 39 protein [Acidobacteriota bacterium]